MTSTPPLQSMVIFAHVVDAGGFSAAARALGLSKSAVSKAVAGLEEHLGVRLLLRTTRKVRLTEAGERLYPHCARMLAEAEQAERELSHHGGRVHGQLRVNAPLSVGRTLVLPVITDLMQRYPELEVDLQLQDDFVDLVATKTDVAVRVGRLVDSSLIMRRIKAVTAHVIASPDFAARYRVTLPDHIAELPFLVYTVAARPDQLTLERDGERVVVRVSGGFRTNNGDAIRDAAIAGQGAAVLPDFLVDDALRDGRLQVLLDDWVVTPSSSVYAVYPQGGPVPPHVRLFIDTLVEHAEGWGSPGLDAA
ncbi:MAG: LysR family transcriptional regulator [Deltaproteobacteria bacterium]|nr:MAG: LysR family transcriptional regulator [Deltaproteobacteria bacterium]